MVLQADDGVAPLPGGLDLFHHPGLQLRADVAAGFVLVCAGIGIVRTVPGGVNGEDGETVLGPGRIG